MRIPKNDVELDEFLKSCQSGTIPMKGWVHPLGFVHVKVFVNGNDDGKIRFRFWHNKMGVDSIGASDRIHNHAFTFTSFVLCGDVIEKRYDLVFNPTGSHRIWEVENLGGHSVLRKTTVRCELSASENISHPSRSSYKMEAGFFHDAIAVSESTATLVFEEPRPEISSLVICPKDLEKITDNVWPEVSQKEIITLIGQVIEKRQRYS